MSTKSRRSRRIDVVITGGGTAGHVLPAMAVGEALCRRGHERDAIFFVGSQRGVEARLFVDSGFRFTLLPGRGLVRRLKLSNVAAVGGLGAAFFRSIGLLVRHRPLAVVCVGGYAGLSCSLAAVLLRIPIVVVSVDAVPGSTNRIVGRFARCSAVAFEPTTLPRAVLTGAPLREEVVTLAVASDARDKSRALFGMENATTVITITGGSLGAWRVNQAALGIARSLREREDVAVYHVTGARDFERVRTMAESLGLFSNSGVDYRIVAYEQRFPELLAATDLAIGRSGAMTVAELSALGVGSILIPLPGAPGDHQRANATALVLLGAAVIIDDADADSTKLLQVIEPLLSDPARRQAMGEAARGLARLDAAGEVARLIDEVGTKRSRRALSKLGGDKKGVAADERRVTR